ncbi:hypothetical protein MTR67_048358 [Solanum verrucosum]
MVYEG